MRTPRSGSLLRVWLSALAGLCAASSAGALEIVVPPSLGDVEGNSNLSSGITSAATSQRYQQIYESSYFGALPGPILIESMAFRPDAQTGRAFAETVPSIQFNMSTTSLDVDTLSANFSANVGADDTILFFNQRLFLSSSFSGPASGPKDFDVSSSSRRPSCTTPRWTTCSSTSGSSTATARS